MYVYMHIEYSPVIVDTAIITVTSTSVSTTPYYIHVVAATVGKAVY